MAVRTILVLDVFKVHFGGCIWAAEDVWGRMYADNSLKSELEERGELAASTASVALSTQLAATGEEHQDVWGRYIVNIMHASSMHVEMFW